MLAEAAPKLPLLRRVILEFHGTRRNPENDVSLLIEILREAGLTPEVRQFGQEVTFSAIQEDDPYWLMVRAERLNPWQRLRRRPQGGRFAQGEPLRSGGVAWLRGEGEEDEEYPLLLTPTTPVLAAEGTPTSPPRKHTNPAIAAGHVREDWVWVGRLERRGWGLRLSQALTHRKVHRFQGGWWVIGYRLSAVGLSSLTTYDFRLTTRPAV